MLWSNEQFQIGQVRGYRSACYGGNQYIQFQEKLNIWNGSRRAWVYGNESRVGAWASPGRHVFVNPFSFELAGGEYGDYSLNIKYTWWRVRQGRWVRIGYRIRRFIHSRDYNCYDPSGGAGHSGSCDVRRLGRRYGVFLWSF